MVGIVGAVKPLATDGVALLCPSGCCQTFALIVQKSLCGREAFHWRHAKPSVTRIPTETSVPDGLSANPEEQGDWLRLEGRGRRGSHGQHRSRAQADSDYARNPAKPRARSSPANDASTKQEVTRSQRLGCSYFAITRASNKQ
jgi:hypothetical protein